MNPDPKILAELVQRTVKSVDPLRIILFGSAARGAMGTHSDLDLLIVMPDGCHRRQIAMKLYREMRGLGCATDIIVAQQSDIEQYGENPYLIYHTALTKGKELYRAS